MSKRQSLEGLLAQAKVEEKKYDWPAAAIVHEEALCLAIESEDFLRAGEIQERIGYCLHRGAFQAGTQEQFKSSMLKAVEAYEKAVGLFDRLEDSQKHSRIICCRARASYSKSWLAEGPSERKALLDECRKLEKEALKVYEDAGDRQGYGKVCNELLTCLDDRLWLAWDWQERKNIVEEAMEYGEKAIEALSEARDEHELARAHSMLSHLLFRSMDEHESIEKQKELNQKSLSYAQKALDISEKMRDPHLISMANGAIAEIVMEFKGDVESSLKHAERQLELSAKTGDILMIAKACNWLAYLGWRKGSREENPDKRRKEFKKANQYAENAMSHYSRVSSRMHAVYYPHIESYSSLAIDETTLEEKLVLLEMAIEVGRKHLEQTQHLGLPSSLLYVYHSLSKALYYLSTMETKISEKKRLLEEASKYRGENIGILERLFPCWHFSRGGSYNYSALIKAELAKTEETNQEKVALLRSAVVDMEECLRLCKIGVEVRPHPGLFGAIGGFKDSFGGILNQLHLLTGEKRHLERSIRIYVEAVEAWKKLDWPSRVAEGHWQMAKVYGLLDEHSNAAREFERASESFGKVAEKIIQLQDFYSEYALYMEAWAELEKARHARENENYARSREHYQKGSRHIEMTTKWSYLSTYYFAWSLLEHGEELSRRDNPQDAVKAFDEAGRTFGDSQKSLSVEVGKLESSEERDEASKLAALAGLRKQYCLGRILMEEAKLLNRTGDRRSSAEKYAFAARIFEEIAPNLEREEARRELEFAATLCRAWEKLELAEERRDAILYRNAAKLFAKAGEITQRGTARLIVAGNSSFCEALELGTKFMATSNMDFYSGAKLRMENAAGYYQRAGFEKAALWVDATKRFLDAHVYAGKAEAEVEPEKRARLYLMAEKCLELSANLFGKAGYLDKRKETLQSLGRMRKERMLALSLSEVLAVPTLLSSTTGISMQDSTEQATGLNEFESVNVRARLSVPAEFVPGEEFQVKLDLINVGKKPGLLVRVEGLVPRRCEVLKMPSYCALEDDSLSLKGKRLNPLSVESVGVWLQVTEMVGLRFSPRVVYVDELGNFRTIHIEEAQILPAVRFESEGAQAIFNCLVDAFVEDSVKRRLSVEQSGWRSLPQIMKGAGVSKRSVYGASGHLGSGLAELRRTGLVDLGTFRGRGRGGHILKARIHRGNELVRRYVKEKAPDPSA